MSWMWRQFRSLLFLLDPEKIHELTLTLMQFWSTLRRVTAKSRVIRIEIPDLKTNVSESVRVLGLTFSSRVGLAAGFDKNAQMIQAASDLGFGFIEVGTVTPLPQDGNLRPRLFRDPPREAIFNRMGFNNQGAVRVAGHLKAARDGGLPPLFRVGVNLGKNKSTPNELAGRDYVQTARAFRGLADYLVINVSSPNTPGLRALQTVEDLKPLVEGVLSEVTSWGGMQSTVPVLLKLAPDLGDQSLTQLVKEGERWGVSGFVLTNTWPGEVSLNGSVVLGGWSGLPLQSASRHALSLARSVSSRPMISVGGVLDEQEAQLRLNLGADLVQIYTGWIYQGPRFPKRLSKSLRVS